MRQVNGRQLYTNSRRRRRENFGNVCSEIVDKCLQILDLGPAARSEPRSKSVRDATEVLNQGFGGANFEKCLDFWCFHIVKLIARISKYDFRIPGEILC